mmetsp:Transcript_52381/g.114265  ORF Transcript_52381/g.114265 Transcript_52381/m.114265 type:complete len:117 (-) Transcript_52381:1053-1403(-)
MNAQVVAQNIIDANTGGNNETEEAAVPDIESTAESRCNLLLTTDHQEAKKKIQAKTATGEALFPLRSRSWDFSYQVVQSQHSNCRLPSVGVAFSGLLKKKVHQSATSDSHCPLSYW